MFHRTRIMVVGATMMALAGCTTYQLITGAEVQPGIAAAAISTSQAVEQALTDYLSLPACGTAAATTPVCYNPKAVQPIANAVRTMRTARAQVIVALKNSGGGPIPVVSMNNLSAAVATAQSYATQYGVAVSAK